MIDRLLHRFGHHFILLMMISTRVFGTIGGLMVIYYVEFTMDMPQSTRLHFRITSLIVVIIASVLTVLLAMRETRNLRQVLKARKQGLGVHARLGALAGGEAVSFAARHHKHEAWIVPCTTLIPVLVVLKVVDDASLTIMVNITIAVFMAISMALMSHFFVTEHCMKSVIRYLLQERTPIDYEAIRPGKLRFRLRVCSALIIATTALMIGTMASLRAGEMIAHPEFQERLVHELRYHSVFITIAALVLGIVYSTIVGDSVAHRVGHLVEAMNRVGGGDLTKRVLPTGNDEIDMLARRFNVMVEQMEVSHQTIRDLNANLEQKVGQRTRELNGTVDALRQTQLKLTAYNEELERARAHAETADKAKSAFLTNISHELRTPLNGVIGLNDLLLNTELTEQQAKYAETARTSGETLLHLLNDLLDFSKIEAGKLELEDIEFDFVQAVESVMNTLAHRCRDDVELICSVDPRTPRCLRGDPGRLRQILTNLVSNALKFTERGDVLVRTNLVEESRRDITIEFEVSDTGIGIPADCLERIFEAFTQADASTTRRYGGTGLGLGICKQLCEMMRGEIRVASSVGEGSCFVFTVRLAKGSKTGQSAITIPDELRHSRILVVDKNDAVCQSLVRQLEAWGLQADVAHNLADGGKRLRTAATRNEAYHLALLDEDLFGSTSESMAIGSRPDAAFGNTKRIALVTLKHGVDVDSLHNNGFAGYLTKPVIQSELRQTILDVLNIASGRHRKEALPSRAASARGNKNQRAPRILLAEDQEINQLVVVEMLIQAGYQCEVVNNGRAAVEALERTPFELVLMDCQMPEMDGLEATQLIRHKESSGQLARAAATPVVALTANAMRGERERCMNAGMTDYLSKPIRPEALIDTIEKHISEYIRQYEQDDGGRHDDPPLSQQAVELAGSEILDIDTLLHRCRGKTQLALKLISKFAARAPGDLAELQSSIDASDAAGLMNAAHAFKGVAASLAAESIQHAAAALEDIGRSGNLDEAAGRLDQLRTEWDHFRKYLERIQSDGAFNSQSEMV